LRTFKLQNQKNIFYLLWLHFHLSHILDIFQAYFHVCFIGKLMSWALRTFSGLWKKKSKCILFLLPLLCVFLTKTLNIWVCSSGYVSKSDLKSGFGKQYRIFWIISVRKPRDHLDVREKNVTLLNPVQFTDDLSCLRRISTQFCHLFWWIIKLSDLWSYLIFGTKNFKYIQEHMQFIRRGKKPARVLFRISYFVWTFLCHFLRCKSISSSSFRFGMLRNGWFFYRM